MKNYVFRLITKLVNRGTFGYNFSVERPVRTSQDRSLSVSHILNLELTANRTAVTVRIG